MSDNHYDVIIIGGRCAGASLAIRLAKTDLKILLVDRATFPSRPNVPSGPFIHPQTMALLDELGLQESKYTHPGSKIESFIVNFGDGFHATVPLSRLGLKRNYLYGIDRNLFDTTLWNRASSRAGITARAGFAVTQVLKDDARRIQGIVGKENNGEEERFTADLFIGADGRFSFSARQFEAKVIEERNEHTSALYMAEWENVQPYSPQHMNAITSYNTGKGLMILVIPIAEGKYHIATFMRSDRVNHGAKAHEATYEAGLRRFDHLWHRLENACRVGDVIGMRPVENGYRQAYGENWALVGDALHYKDPTDAQGIYDALIESKLLTELIIKWKQNGASWASAGREYQQKVMDHTHAVFEQTVQNVKQTLYDEAPAFLFKRIGRLLMSDPDFQTSYLRYLSRAISPAEFRTTTRQIPKFIMRGLISQIRKR